MFFIEELKRIICEKKIENLGIFVDMDGVIADYRFGEGNNIINNIAGTYGNKRPIKTTINNLKEISKNVKCDMHIISSCLFKEQKEEKIDWIKENIPFINKNNVNIMISKNFELRKELKVEKVLEIMKANKYDYSILIDDTHEILFLAIKKSEGRIIPMHVITLLD